MATCLYTAFSIELIHMKYRSFTLIIGCPEASELNFIDETILSSRPETQLLDFCFPWKSQQSIGNSQFSNWLCLVVEFAKSPVGHFLDTRFPGALTIPVFACKVIFLKVP